MKIPSQDFRTILISLKGVNDLVKKFHKKNPISEEVESVLNKYEIYIDNTKELTVYSYVNNHLMFEYFVALEIITLLDYKNITQALLTVSPCNKLLFKDFPGSKIPKLDPKSVLLTRDGVVELLIKTRKRLTPDILHLLKEFGIDTTNKKCLTKEQQTLSAITNAFKQEKFEDQYKVGNYYLDLFFTDYQIVIECDENGHSDRRPSDERERMDFVNNELEIDDTHWIRYNPDEFDFDISRVINKIYQKMDEIKSCRLFEEKLEIELENLAIQEKLEEEKRAIQEKFEQEKREMQEKLEDEKRAIEEKNRALLIAIEEERDKRLEIKERSCQVCGVRKQLTVEFYNPIMTKGKTGFSLTCKECVKLTGKEMAVRQYDSYGKFLAEFVSVKEASAKTGVDASMIAQCCRGRMKSGKNFLWKYVSNLDANDPNKDIEEKSNEITREVAQYDTDGNFIRKYKSGAEAARAVNGKPPSIYGAIRNNFVSYGFVWKYVEDGVPLEKVEKVAPFKKYMKPVEIWNGEELLSTHNCIKDAAVSAKLNVSFARKILSGDRKDSRGYQWRFKNLESAAAAAP